MNAADRTTERNRARDREDGRADYGALEPCGYCGQVCKPGTCPSPDTDLFGGLIVPEPEQPGYMTSRPRAEQARLFEPQMEGQLSLADNETGDLTVPE